MLRWFRESAALDNKLHVAFASIVAPAALAWGVAVWEYSQVSAAARAEPASSYLQVLCYGMEASLTAFTGALALMLLAGLISRRWLSRPIEAATAYLEASLEGPSDAPPPFRGRLDTAGRIADAAARLAELRRQAARLQAALDAAMETQSTERRLVLAALAPPPPSRKMAPVASPAAADPDLDLVALLQRLQDTRVVREDHHDLAMPRWL